MAFKKKSASPKMPGPVAQAIRFETTDRDVVKQLTARGHQPLAVRSPDATRPDKLYIYAFAPVELTAKLA